MNYADTKVFLAKHPRPEAIDMNRLYKALGFKGKIIPSDMAVTLLSFPCPNFYGDIIGRYNLTILPSRTKETGILKHRIFVVCGCRRLIPAGRLRSHNCPHHYEWADRYPFKAVRANAERVSYHKSRESALQRAGKYARIYAWDLADDRWGELCSGNDADVVNADAD
jgi:hypothetical protein